MYITYPKHKYPSDQGMALLNYYRNMIVLSGPLQRSIDLLDINPYTVANMSFNRRSNGPLVLTDHLRFQIRYDANELEESGFIEDYNENSNAEAFEIYQNREIPMSESDPQTEQELLDCVLILSLRALAVPVDFDTFCNLRVRVPFGFYGYNESDNESESSDDTAEAFQVRQHAVREALEHEDKCCVCLENFPNATFVGCRKVGVCCCFCANKILEWGMTCPHCRAKVSTFNAGQLFPEADS